MYILSADKTILSKIDDLVIEKTDYFGINEYGEKKFIYTISNNKYILGRYINFENAKKMFDYIIKKYTSPMMYDIIEIEDDEEEILRCLG